MATLDIISMVIVNWFKIIVNWYRFIGVQDSNELSLSEISLSEKSLLVPPEGYRKDEGWA